MLSVCACNLFIDELHRWVCGSSRCPCRAGQASPLVSRPSSRCLSRSSWFAGPGETAALPVLCACVHVYACACVCARACVCALSYLCHRSRWRLQTAFSVTFPASSPASSWRRGCSTRRRRTGSSQRWCVSSSARVSVVRAPRPRLTCRCSRAGVWSCRAGVQPSGDNDGADSLCRRRVRACCAVHVVRPAGTYLSRRRCMRACVRACVRTCAGMRPCVGRAAP